MSRRRTRTAESVIKSGGTASRKWNREMAATFARCTKSMEASARRTKSVRFSWATNQPKDVPVTAARMHFKGDACHALRRMVHAWFVTMVTCPHFAIHALRVISILLFGLAEWSPGKGNWFKNVCQKDRKASAVFTNLTGRKIQVLAVILGCASQTAVMQTTL